MTMNDMNNTMREFGLHYVLCNKIGADFHCELCNDTFCSRDCQAMHGSIYRRICFPMPNLIELQNPTSLYDEPSYQYSTKSRYSTTIRNSYNHRYNPSKDVNQICSRFTGYSSSQQLSDSFEDDSVTEKVSRYLLDGSPIEKFTELKKWSEEFLFGEVTEVVVQYFSENPTTNCWVIQQKDIEQRNAILNHLNYCRFLNPIDTGSIKINNVYSVQYQGVFHRGIVLYRINSLEVLVRLIDNGRTLRTRISTITELDQVTANSKGLAFEISFEQLRHVSTDEVLRVENICYNPHEAIDVRLVEEEQIYTDKDIDLRPLPVGEPAELFCLDYSNIDMGYISVCESDRRKIETINSISDKILEYCKDVNEDKSYCPKLTELCLAYIEREGQWYRSKCVEYIMPNTFKLEMIDYGAMEVICSKNIRKMVKDFIEPSLIMHQCSIYGIPSRPDSKTSRKVIAFLNRYPFFCIKQAKLFGERYVLYVPDLLKFIDEFEDFG